MQETYTLKRVLWCIGLGTFSDIKETDMPSPYDDLPDKERSYLAQSIERLIAIAKREGNEDFLNEMTDFVVNYLGDD